MPIVHEHDADVITAQGTPSVLLLASTGPPESQDSFVPSDRLAHILGLKHRHQLLKPGHEILRCHFIALPA
jgi:hypothetical protein